MISHLQHALPPHLQQLWWPPRPAVVSRLEPPTATDRADIRPQPVYGDFITGQVQLVQQFPSRILNNKRDVVVYLPPGYGWPENARKRYPVIYVHDGQNLFDRNTSAFGTEWGLDETAERLIRQGDMQEAIFVGVYNTGTSRLWEYTPVPDPEYGGGGADRYGDFLIRELKPYIDTQYRTKPDAENTRLMGSSLGGLVSLYLSFKHPEIFSVSIAVSPSLWWADGYMIDKIRTHEGAAPKAIWLDMGTNEGKNPTRHLENTRKLKEVLQSKGYVEGETLFYHEAEGGKHNEADWAQRSPLILSTMLPPEGALKSR